MRDPSRRDLLAAGLLVLSRSARAAQGESLRAHALTFLQSPSEGPPLDAWAFDGQVGARVLRPTHGQPSQLRFVNALPEPVSLRPCGLRFPKAALIDAVASGEAREIAWSAPDSGFGLLLAETSAGGLAPRRRGLIAAVIVSESQPTPVDMDVLAILQDWKAEGGSNVTTIGGAPAPAVRAVSPRARVRLRFANASVARLATIAIAGAVASVVAVDSQPSELFRPLRDQFPLPPLARVELVFDMPDAPDSEVRFSLAGEAAAPLVVFRSEGDVAPSRPPVAALPANPSLPENLALERALHVQVSVIETGSNRFAVEGAEAGKPLFRVKAGSPVTLVYRNKTATTLAMRLDGHVGRLLHGLDDGWDPYWRDIVLIAPGKSALLAFNADNPGRWSIDSANAETAAAGVATTFDVG